MGIPLAALPVGLRRGLFPSWPGNRSSRYRGRGFASTSAYVVKAWWSVTSRYTGFTPRHVTDIHASIGTFFLRTVALPSRRAATVLPSLWFSLMITYLHHSERLRPTVDIQVYHTIFRLRERPLACPRPLCHHDVCCEQVTDPLLCCPAPLLSGCTYATCAFVRLLVETLRLAAGSPSPTWPGERSGLRLVPLLGGGTCSPYRLLAPRSPPHQSGSVPSYPSQSCFDD